MSKPKSVQPPDPRDTAAAQTGQNVDTSIANTMMSNVNQVGPDGSTLTYDQTGSHNWTNEYTGESYEAPTFTATTSLSDMGQSIFDANQQSQLNLAQTGRDQSAFLQDYLGEPWKADTSEIESHLFDLGSRTLDPKFDQQHDDMATRLSNQGIKLGSAAYDRAMGGMRDTQNDAYTRLALSGRGQAFSELQAQRNQPINEISALMSGSQVSMPNMQVNSPSSMANTDVTGIINENFNQKMNIYNSEMNQWNNTMGGLMGLGSSLVMSDERTKKDVKKVGKTDDGQNVYQFRYKSGGPIQMGLMAQEVEKKKPQAVKDIGGIKMVDYGKALKSA